MADLAADLNEPVFQDAVRRWLPGLNVEVAKHRWGSTTMKIGWIPGEILARYEASTDEWLAPNPLNGLIKPLRSNQDLDLTGQAPPTLSRPTSASPPASPHQTGQAATPPRPTSPQTSQLTAEGSEVLAQNPLQKLMGIETLANQGDTTIRTPEPPVQDPGLANNDTNPGDQSLQPQTNSQETSVEVDVPNNQPLLKELLGVVPVISNGGWFRDDQVFQVTYRPGGHADRCIQSWTDFVAEIPDANIRTDTSSLFAKLTSASGVGKCRSCHTVDQMDDNSFRVNWEPNYRDVSFRSFTRFSHGSHVMQPMLQDCKHCHELDSQRSNKDSFISFDSSQAISNFKPIQKANCTTCHREGQTSNSCTQCHNYHIGSHVIGTNHK